MVLSRHREKSIKQRKLALVKNIFELERELAKFTLLDYEELQLDIFIPANTGNGGFNNIKPLNYVIGLHSSL